MSQEKIRHFIGPSIIIAAAVVGSGELIVAPRLGAEAGFMALWIIVLGCLVKVFLQEEIGRHTLLTGETTLEAFNRVPGPKWRLSWVSWAWLLLLMSTSLQQGGILSTITQALKMLNFPGDPTVIAGGVAVFTAVTLIIGHYGFIEKSSGFIVALFTFITVLALFLLQRTEYAISASSIASGFTFRMPDAGFASAMAVFGITGIGTSELLFYPYWCLEKGYAKDIEPGKTRDPKALRVRVLGMRVDITLALFVYTFATIAFFLLGASVLHGRDEIPEGLNMVQTLSQMYTESFGPWMFNMFAIGAFVVLFSTYFIGVATFSRILGDTIRLASAKPESFNKDKWLPWLIVGLTVVYFALGFGFKERPDWLIITGAAVQTILLPVFGFAIVIIRKTRQDPFRPGKWFDAGLYLSMVVITFASVYGLLKIFGVIS